MKKSTAFGAVLCSAALAMGMAMPALGAYDPAALQTDETDAPGSAGGTLTEANSTTTGTTEVNLYGYAKESQLIATLPVALTVSAPAYGGKLTCPTSAAYKIENGSTFPIQVQKAKADKLGTDWSIASNDDAAAVAAMADSKWASGASLTDADETQLKAYKSTNNIALALQGPKDYAGKTSGVTWITGEGSGTTLTSVKDGTGVEAANMANAPSVFAVPAKTGDVNGSLGLELSGWAAPKATVDTDSISGITPFSTTATQSAAKITYTIGKTV